MVTIWSLGALILMIYRVTVVQTWNFRPQGQTFLPNFEQSQEIQCSHSNLFTSHLKWDKAHALDCLYNTIYRLENLYPEAAFIVVRDINRATMNFSLNITKSLIFPHSEQTLDHCYSASNNYYPCPVLGNSDHNSILLLLKHRKRQKQEAAFCKMVCRWKEQPILMFKWLLWNHKMGNIKLHIDYIVTHIFKCTDI